MDRRTVRNRSKKKFPELLAEVWTHFHSSKYENIVLLCYFNSCIDDFPMIGFSETYKLRNLVKHPTCF